MLNIFYGWWIVIACFLIAFYIGGACFYGFTAFFEPIVAEFGWSYTQVSIAFSLRGLEMGILAQIVGFLVTASVQESWHSPAHLSWGVPSSFSA